MPVSLTMHPLQIPFKASFSHASATRSCTESVLVCAELGDGITGHGEGCPRQYVTSESVETAQQFFAKQMHAFDELADLEDLKQWTKAHVSEVDANPAAYCAVEMALLDAWAQAKKQTLEEYIGSSALTSAYTYSAVLGAGSMQTFQKQMAQYHALGIRDYKLKITGDIANDGERTAKVYELNNSNARLRFDANNLWDTPASAVDYLKAMPYAFWAVEEPIKARDYVGMANIAQALDCKIILDESFLKLSDFSELQHQPSIWVINVRISKMGGLLRSLEVAKQAEQLGIPIIIGAQVGETSLLSRAALTVASATPNNLLAQEGAFGTYLLEHDVVSSPLMFTTNGKLGLDALDMPYGMQLCTVYPPPLQ